MQQSQLKQDDRISPLKQMQLLKNGGTPAGGKVQKDLAPVLSLTSLIDAFSIIVIYLLIGTQSGGMETEIPSKMNLPMAAKGGLVTEKTSIVRIEKGEFYIDDQKVSAKDLGQYLYRLKEQNGNGELPLLVQGDRDMNYAQLDPLLKAGSEAGIQKLKFAVVPNQ